MNRKYSHIKKPLGNIKYRIIDKKENGVFCCGPCGSEYEIEFLLVDENKHLFVNSDDMYGFMELRDYSLFEQNEKEEKGEETIYCLPIEEYESFEETKESDYYDLFLEMEKFKDETI